MMEHVCIFYHPPVTLQCTQNKNRLISEFQDGIISLTNRLHYITDIYYILRNKYMLKSYVSIIIIPNDAPVSMFLLETCSVIRPVRNLKKIYFSSVEKVKF